MGESAPFDSYAITHGVCRNCVHLGRMSDRFYLQRIKAVVEFFTGLQGAVQAGRRVPAAAILAEGQRLGIRPTDLLVGIIQPLLAEMGERCLLSQVPTEMELEFTATCESLVRGVEGLLSRPIDGPPDVLLVNAEGNQHSLGIRFVELLLRDAGVAAQAVTSEMSAGQIVDLVERRRPQLVGISVATNEQRQNLPRVVGQLEALPEELRPKVMLGGPALKGAPAEPELSACYLAPPNTLELIDRVGELVASRRAAEARRLSAAAWGYYKIS
jgi:methylmalonyl-CoA mutase cobalamin-binding subunit